ncbi:MAG: hypothetical protein V4519_05075 [Patescibacteria group bacterium]
MNEGFGSYQEEEPTNDHEHGHVYHEPPKSREQITKSLDQILLNLYMDDPQKTKELLTGFATRLQTKYQNYKQYELYYLLVSDKEKPEEKCTLFDFQSPDSVQAFIESLNPEA